MSTSRLALALAIAMEVVVAAPANGVTFNVADGDTAGLFDAILQSNGNIYADTINLAPGGTYTLTTGAVNADGPSALPSITSAITINGNGALLQRDPFATTDFRMLRINLSGNLIVNDLTIANGQSNGNGGGAFWVDGGRLTLSRCTLVNNIALNAEGGAISSRNGTITLTNCTLSGNHADNAGGAVYCRDTGGRVTFTAVTASDNTTNGNGGGVCFDNGATFNVSDSILSGSANGDCALPNGVLNDLGYNLVEDGSCLADATSFAANPMLGPLQNNGGSTLTHALPTDSPAVDVIPVPDCAFNTDQRGNARPRGAGCDIGAFEADPPPGLTIDSMADVESAGVLRFTLTLSFSADVDVQVGYVTVDGSATVADQDYTAASGTVTLAAGTTSILLNVPIIDDGYEEDDETLTVRLTNPTGAVLAVDTAVGTILNDDAAPVPQCRANVVVDVGSNCQASVSPDELLANNLSVDPRCEPLTLQLTPDGPFDVGAHTVTLSATDGCDQTNSCQATFVVQGGPTLALHCAANWLTTTDGGQCHATVSGVGLDPAVSLPCALVNTHVSNDFNGDSTLDGARFPVGVTVVTWTLADDEGQIDTCEMAVDVVDAEPPVIACPPGPVNASDVEDSLILPVLDNCDTAPLVECSPAVLSDVPSGDSDVEVLCTATDASGNTTTCSYVLRRSMDFDLSQAFMKLKSEVNRLRHAHVLSWRQAHTLKRMLNKARQRLVNGQTIAGCNKLNAFYNHVGALVNQGTLTETQAEPLRDGYKVIFGDQCVDDETDTSGGDDGTEGPDTENGNSGNDNSGNGANTNDNSDGGDNGNDNTETGEGGGGTTGPTLPIDPREDCGTTDAAMLVALPLMFAPRHWSRRSKQRSRKCNK